MKNKKAIDDPDLNQESVTDAMRGENHIPDSNSRKNNKKAAEQN